MSEFWSGLFTKREEKTPPQRQPPTFYKREDDERVEVLHRLSSKIAECDKKINYYKQQIAEYDQRIRTNKELYDRFKNKQATQAQALRNDTISIMTEKEKLERLLGNYQQQKTTATLHHENLNSIVDVEEMNELTKMSTVHIQKAVNKIDLHGAKTSASEARTASKTASQLTSYIINPLDIDPMENQAIFSDAFDKLDFGVNEELSEEEYLYPVATSKKQPLTASSNKKTSTYSSVLDDELL
jgi:chromosome segregation ATPase